MPAETICHRMAAASRKALNNKHYNGAFLMTLYRPVHFAVVSLLLTGCSRQTAANTSDNSPPVAPMAGLTPPGSTHYTQADFDSACYRYPTKQEIAQTQQFLGMTAQAAVDFSHSTWAKKFPPPVGFCQARQDIAKQKQQQQAAGQGHWIENAPGNDMSHYGDALPHGNN